MNVLRSRIGFAALFSILCGSALAQSLPTTIEGRWIWRLGSQSFAIKEIKQTSEQTFSAKLDWYTLDSRCTLRGAPVEGKLVDGGLDFEAAHNCGGTFTVSLRRKGDEWAGPAQLKGGETFEVRGK